MSDFKTKFDVTSASGLCNNRALLQSLVDGNHPLSFMYSGSVQVQDSAPERRQPNITVYQRLGICADTDLLPKLLKLIELS